MGFNRTFMELKWACTHLWVQRCAGFNRTFMELKYKQSY